MFDGVVYLRIKSPRRRTQTKRSKVLPLINRHPKEYAFKFGAFTLVYGKFRYTEVLGSRTIDDPQWLKPRVVLIEGLTSKIQYWDKSYPFSRGCREPGYHCPQKSLLAQDMKTLRPAWEL